MKNIITKITQTIADGIIIKLNDSKSDQEFNFWMAQGLNLNNFCINRDIYLD